MATTDHAYTFEELYEILERSMGSLPSGLTFEQRAYLESTYPVESVEESQALLEKFAKIEGRLGKNVGFPVLLVRTGDLDAEILYMGVVSETKLIFRQHENGGLPGGSVSVDVLRCQGYVVNSANPNEIFLDMAPGTQGTRDTYFPIEERQFKHCDVAEANNLLPSSECDASQSAELFECQSTDWQLMIGNREIETFLFENPKYTEIVEQMRKRMHGCVVEVQERPIRQIPELGIARKYGKDGQINRGD